MEGNYRDSQEWYLGQKDEGQGQLRMAKQEQNKSGPIWQEVEQSHHRGRTLWVSTEAREL